MLDFLSAIADALGTFLHFLGNLVAGTFAVFSFGTSSIQWLNVALSYMPSVLLGFATTGIILVFIYHFIGR